MFDDEIEFIYPTWKITKNQVLFTPLTEAYYRVLYLSNDGNGYWIQINSSSNIPKPFFLSDLIEKINSGIFIVHSDIVTVLDDESLSPKETKHKDRVWGLIHNIVTIEPDIYISSKRSQLLKSVEVASGVKSCKIYNYLGKYWRSGFQPNALAPNYSRCGGAREATSLENRAGRHKQTGNNGKVLNEDDFKYFQQAVLKYIRHGAGIKGAYERMLSEYYVRPRFEGDPKPITMDADEKPSYDQFYYWYQKNGNLVDDTKALEGEYNFNLNHRAILGKTETSLIGPADVYQIDATIGDFYLVMASNRSRLIGRPVLVFIKDAWTRMITGMAVTLENTSFRVWREALLNAVSSKIDYCARFDISITKEEWPCEILPISMTTDNGEFAVKAVDEIVQTLGITVENCPPYRGDLKGIIERNFKTLQLELKPFIPGYVDKDAGQRGAVDYRKNSCLDIITFTRIIIQTVLYYNNYHHIEKYERTSDLRENNIPAIPLHLWNYGMKHRSGSQKIIGREDCLTAFFDKGEATITPKGIRALNGLYYTCDIAQKENWYEKARIKDNWKVPIRYNPFSCTNIYIVGDEGQYYECSLVEASNQYRKMTVEELAKVHQDNLESKAATTQAENQAHSDLIHFINSEVERCKGEKESGKVIIETLNKHSMKESRQEEKQILTGEAEAREQQASLETDGEETLGDKAKKETNSEKPRSYETVSNEIDKIINKMLNEAGEGK